MKQNRARYGGKEPALQKEQAEAWRETFSDPSPSMAVETSGNTCGDGESIFPLLSTRAHLLSWFNNGTLSIFSLPEWIQALLGVWLWIEVSFRAQSMWSSSSAAPLLAKELSTIYNQCCEMPWAWWWKMQELSPTELNKRIWNRWILLPLPRRVVKMTETLVSHHREEDRCGLHNME